MHQYVRPPVAGTARTPAARDIRPKPKPKPRLRLGWILSWILILTSLVAVICASFTFCVMIDQGDFSPPQDNAILQQRDPPIIATSEDESHGSTLQEVLTNIRNEPYEIFAAFDRYGGKLFEYTNYDYNTVVITQQLLRYYQENDGSCIVHNHPSAEGPFSFDDLEMACIFDADVTIVTTYNYDFYLEPNENRWPQLGTLYDWQRKHHSDYADDEYWVAITTKDVKTGIEHKGLSTTDKLIQRFADDFDLTFYKTEPMSDDRVGGEIVAPR